MNTGSGSEYSPPAPRPKHTLTLQSPIYSLISELGSPYASTQLIEFPLFLGSFHEISSLANSLKFEIFYLFFSFFNLF